MTTNTTAWRAFGLCAGSRTCKFLEIGDMTESPEMILLSLLWEFRRRMFDNGPLQSVPCVHTPV